MEMPEIKAKTIAINCLVMLIVMALFYFGVWSGSLSGVHLVGACIGPWVMIPLQVVVVQGGASRYKIINHTIGMMALALPLSVVNVLYTWGVSIVILSS